MDHTYVQELEYKDTLFGRCLYLKIRGVDDNPMAWAEVWATFADRYPGKWAVQFSRR